MMNNIIDLCWAEISSGPFFYGLVWHLVSAYQKYSSPVKNRIYKHTAFYYLYYIQIEPISIHQSFCVSIHFNNFVVRYMT